MPAASGAAASTSLPALNTPHNLRVELEYADPNGEIQTVSRTAPWWPANVVLGLKNDRWTRAGQTHTLRFQAVDLAGKAAADVPVEAKLTLRQTFSHRVRLAGGFYGYHSETRETAIARGMQRQDRRQRPVRLRSQDASKAAKSRSARARSTAPAAPRRRITASGSPAATNGYSIRPTMTAST